MEPKKVLDMLNEAESLICNCLDVSDGLQYTNNQLLEKQYNSTSAGAFGLITKALDRVCEIISEIESEFNGGSQ